MWRRKPLLQGASLGAVNNSLCHNTPNISAVVVSASGSTLSSSQLRLRVGGTMLRQQRTTKTTLAYNTHNNNNATTSSFLLMATGVGVVAGVASTTLYPAHIECSSALARSVLYFICISILHFVFLLVFLFIICISCIFCFLFCLLFLFIFLVVQVPKSSDLDKMEKTFLKYATLKKGDEWLMTPEDFIHSMLPEQKDGILYSLYLSAKTFFLLLKPANFPKTKYRRKRLTK